MFKESFPNITSFSLFDNINQDFFDYQIPLTSIAEYCRNSVEDFPKKVAPYLNLVESKVHNPRFSRKLKCALSWNSSLGTHSALKRIPLESFKKILQMEQIEFFNIQYNHGGDDLINEVNEVSKKYNVKLYDPGIDVKDDIRGLIDFIGDCDFVISCSNTNVHLSGAIGKKIYALLPVPAGRFWYWENNFEGKNLWYPSMDIIKQEERYSWETPIKILYEMIKNDFNL